MKQHKFERRSTKQGWVIVLDPASYRTRTSQAIDTLCSLCMAPGAESQIDVRSLLRAQGDAIRHILRSSPLGQEMGGRFAGAPDLRVGIEPWMNFTLKNGDDVIKANFGLNERAEDVGGLITATAGDAVANNAQTRSAMVRETFKRRSNTRPERFILAITRRMN